MKSLVFPILGIILVAGLIFHRPIILYSTQKTVLITVKDKERVSSGIGENRKSYYVVYTEGQTYKNRDSIWFWKFRSSDIQGALEVGKTYTVKTAGVRVPFLSMHKNIIKIK